jgi:hypothetical protein
MYSVHGIQYTALYCTYKYGAAFYYSILVECAFPSSKRVTLDPLQSRMVGSCIRAQNYIFVKLNLKGISLLKETIFHKKYMYSLGNKDFRDIFFQFCFSIIFLH